MLAMTENNFSAKRKKKKHSTVEESTSRAPIEAVCKSPINSINVLLYHNSFVELMYVEQRHKRQMKEFVQIVDMLCSCVIAINRIGSIQASIKHEGLELFPLSSGLFKNSTNTVQLANNENYEDSFVFFLMQ